MSARGLAARLRDGSLTGVYRVAAAEDVVAAAAAARLELVHISLEGVRDKQILLERVAAALGFPDWFGGNWDALEDCLTDLSWRKAEGWVLAIEHAAALSERAPDDWNALREILAASGAYWREQAVPFVVAFADPERVLDLPDLPSASDA
jgi:hypothetical protein